jgi:hypothetical protein
MFSIKKMPHKFHVVLLLLLAFFTSLVKAQSWTPVTGPSSPNFGNQTRGWSVSTEDNTLWASLGYSGLYKSTDHGVSWTPNNFGFEGQNLLSVMVDNSTSPYKIYVAVWQKGIYLSTDRGQSFQQTTSNGLDSKSVGIFSLYGSRLFLGTRNCYSNCGAYFSDDQGANWIKSAGIPSTAAINGFTFGGGGGGSFLLVATSAGLYRSTDNGVSFSLLNVSGPPAMISTPGGASGPQVGKVNILNSSTALAPFLNGGGVYRSIDGGVNWSASNNGLPNSSNIFNLSCIYDSSTNGNICYAFIDGFGVYTSTDDGQSWTASTASYPSGLVSIGAWNINGNRYFGESTNQGLYTSTSLQSGFAKGIGQPLGYIESVDFDSNGTVYASTVNGVYKQSSSGSWNHLSGLPLTGSVGIKGGNIIASGTNIFAGTDNLGVYKWDTTSSNPAWVPMNNGLPAQLYGRSVHIKANPSVNGSYYAGTYGAGFFFWDGVSNAWVAKNSGLAGDALFITDIQAVGQQVIISTDAGLYITKDNATTWTFNGPKDSSNIAIRTGMAAIDPVNPSALYVVVRVFDGGGNLRPYSGIYKSINSGATWTQLPTFQGIQTKAVSIINVGGASTLVVGSFGEFGDKNGVYFSLDGGVSWTKTSMGLNTNFIEHVDSNSNGSKIFLSSREGLYSFSLGSAFSANAVSGWNLMGNSWNSPISVSSLFGDANKVKTVWKWDRVNKTWSFYTPTMSDGGLAYATQNGFSALTTLNPGDGFWVNAVTAFDINLPFVGSIVNCSSFSTLTTGWSLIASGDNKVPRAFNNCLGNSPPAAGTVASNQVISLWAWESNRAQWYFYAPDLDNSATLSSFATSKNFLDFGSTPLSLGTGFWVNRP